MPFASSNEKELGIEGKSVTFTFGLLSPDKGIEHVIDALPVLLARYPDRLTVLTKMTGSNGRPSDWCARD